LKPEWATEIDMNGRPPEKNTGEKLTPRATASVNRESRAKSALLLTEIAVRDRRSTSLPWPLSWKSWLTAEI